MKEIKGWEKYFITECGKVYSTKRKVKKQLSIKITRGGYPSVHLCSPSGDRWPTIHRLVAENYIPNPENKPTVNHIDGNKLNNNVSNLEWATVSENVQHSFDTGLKKQHKGSKNPASKLNEVQVAEIKKLLREGKTLTYIADIYGVCFQLISSIKNNKIWTQIS